MSSSAGLTADALLQMSKTRRSVYSLTKDLPVPASRVTELVRETTLHVPSSFNTQSNRLLVLHGADHDKFWSITETALRAIVPDDAWAHTAGRLAAFQAAAGTVLFFSDQDTVSAIQAKFPTYADKFPVWADQSLGMQQWMLWTALSLEGLGCNLQHYNPLVDEQVVDTWGVPKTWKLNAQLVFGGKGADAGDKEFAPIDERVKVFGA